MWMLFLSSFINFCLASNLLHCVWSFLCFSFFLAFWPFPWKRQPFWKNLLLTEQLHMAYDIPTRFHKIWSRHLREMCRRNFWQKKERRRRIIIRNEANIICLPLCLGDIINLFSPWYSWKNAKLALNNNHSLTFVWSNFLAILMSMCIK
jgi:hypothetical protein